MFDKIDEGYALLFDGNSDPEDGFDRILSTEPFLGVVPDLVEEPIPLLPSCNLRIPNDIDWVRCEKKQCQTVTYKPKFSFVTSTDFKRIFTLRRYLKLPKCRIVCHNNIYYLV